MHVDWGNSEEIRNLSVVDPACGTGTLLVAASQEIRHRHIRARLDRGEQPSATLDGDLLEHTLYGYDVVHAVIHLAAATLAMMETARPIHGTNLFPMPLSVDRSSRGHPVALLGSLDFLSSSASAPLTLDLFSHATQGTLEGRRGASGTSHSPRPAQMPPIDLAILNPPFFKSQGIIESEEEGTSSWKSFYGLMASEEDGALMREELQRRLRNTAGSMKAGGSPFMVLIDERIKDEGSFACVLPTAVWTGSSWREMRDLWARRYRFDWIVVSHDDRHRPARDAVPGRSFVSMSKSTRIAEALIVARRHGAGVRGTVTKVVNLAHNPDHPIDASNLARQLLALDPNETPSLDERPGPTRQISAGENRDAWGEVLRINWSEDVTRNTENIGRLIGIATALRSTELMQIGWHLSNGRLWLPGCQPIDVPICTVDELATTGPWHHSIKGSQGPYRIVETGDRGRPAIWHHKADLVTSVRADANAWLLVKRGRASEADQQWEYSGRLHVALELRLASQRIAAAWTKSPLLGIRSWNTLKLRGSLQACMSCEKALTLWFNSTLGLLLRVLHGNRPYLGRVSLPIEVLRELPVLDVRRLTPANLSSIDRLWEEIAPRSLLPFANAEADDTRKIIDERIGTELFQLNQQAIDELHALRRRLVAEPMIHVRF